MLELASCMAAKVTSLNTDNALEPQWESVRKRPPNVDLTELQVMLQGPRDVLNRLGRTFSVGCRKFPCLLRRSTKNIIKL